MSSGCIELNHFLSTCMSGRSVLLKHIKSLFVCDFVPHMPILKRHHESLCFIAEDDAEKNGSHLRSTTSGKKRRRQKKVTGVRTSSKHYMLRLVRAFNLW